MIKCVYLSQQDLQIRGSGGGGAVIQTLRKGGGGGTQPKKKLFSAQKKRRGAGPSPVICFRHLLGPTSISAITTAEGKINNKKERIPLRPVNIVSRGDWF